MIVLEQVSVIKGTRTIIDQVSLRLSEQRIGLIGANGSGKSTLVRLLNGLQRSHQGQVLIDGEPAGKASRRVGFVFQNPDNQIVMPVVEDDIAFGLRRSGLAREAIRERVHAGLRRHGLEHLAQRQTHELSGGEKQLIALIGVLILEPDYIVLDEPTTLLDLGHRRRLLDTLAALPQPLIIVSHDLDFMLDMQRVIALEQGRVSDDGEPARVIAAYRQRFDRPGAC